MNDKGMSRENWRKRSLSRIAVAGWSKKKLALAWAIAVLAILVFVPLAVLWFYFFFGPTI